MSIGPKLATPNAAIWAMRCAGLLEKGGDVREAFRRGAGGDPGFGQQRAVGARQRQHEFGTAGLNRPGQLVHRASLPASAGAD